MRCHRLTEAQLYALRWARQQPTVPKHPGLRMRRSMEVLRGLGLVRYAGFDERSYVITGHGRVIADRFPRWRGFSAERERRQKVWNDAVARGQAHVARTK